MNEQQFEDLLDRYGGDLTQWPDDQAQAAENLLAESPTAVESLRMQVLMDQQFAMADKPADTFGLERRIIEKLRHSSAHRPLSSWVQISWRPALAAACSLAFGLYLGATTQTYPLELEDDVAAVMFYDYETGEIELSDES